MTDLTITERAFESLADASLRALERALHECELGFEADLQNGILTIEFEDGSKYVLNSHRAARQIWMAAERAAWHFDYDDKTLQWITTKGRDELWTTLESVLSRKVKSSVVLPRP